MKNENHALLQRLKDLELCQNFLDNNKHNTDQGISLLRERVIDLKVAIIKGEY